MSYEAFQEDNISLTEAKEAAERLSFYPTMFQAAVALNRTGIMQALANAGRKGTTSEALSKETGISQYGVETLLEAGLSLNLVKLVELYKLGTQIVIWLRTDVVFSQCSVRFVIN